MLRPILEELYHGRIVPMEGSYRHSKELKALQARIKEEEERLLGKLPPEEHQHFHDLGDLYMRETGTYDAELYADGFILGALLLMEVLTCKEIIVRAP